MLASRLISESCRQQGVTRDQLRIGELLGLRWEDVDWKRNSVYIKPLFLTALLHRLAAQAGVPDIRFHDLRHRHATLLLRQGRGDT